MSANRIRSQLYQCFDEYSYGIVDARNVEYLSSAGIGLLIEMMTSFRDHYIVFTYVNPEILKLLKIDVFAKITKTRLYDNIEDAMKAVLDYAK